MTMINDGADPRRQDDVDPLALETEAELLVGRPPSTASPLLIGGVFAAIAIALFLMLNARRVGGTTDVLVTTGAETSALSAPPPPLDAPVPQTMPANTILIDQPTPVAAPPPPAPPLVLNQGVVGVPIDMMQRRRAPAVVVDLQSSANPALLQASFGAASSAPTTAATPGSGAFGAAAGPAVAALAAAGQAPGPGARNAASADPAGQVADAAPEVAVASQMSNLSGIITQGAMLPAVLETALSSDLPGYARAVVSRDVRSFDGRAILIPRGSRLIGQYRSAVALGQSRVFVIWTRVIRPDGVTVQIGSPGADALGRGGLQGEVNSHFFSRFGGSILLSVLNAGVASASRTPATQITIGSPAAAAAAAGSASFGQADIAPTISIKQGEAIRIFVARDLDFSGVQSVR